MKLRPQLFGAAAALLVSGSVAAVHASSSATADPALPTFTVAVQSPATLHSNGTASVPVLLSCTDASYALVDVRLVQMIGRQVGSSIGSTSAGCSTTPQMITVTVPNWYQSGSSYAVATATGCAYGCSSGTASANINVQ